jgi:hypothetical protein
MCAHALLAKLSAADWERNAPARTLKLIARPPGPKLGSGKLGTPCLRMQSAYLIPCEAPLLAAALGLPEDPHAASATAQTSAAHTKHKSLFISSARYTPRGITTP